MFVGVILLIVVYVYVYRKKFSLEFGPLTEGFTSRCSSKSLVRDPVRPEVAQLGVGTLLPTKAVGEIPSSAYTPSRAASLPYRNPGTEPARYIHILSALQQFQAFFGFEAPALESECSPTVVLPLQTARADMSQLETQSDVLERNPGIPSVITTKELAQMMSNLRYLQKMARKMGANSGTAILGATEEPTVEGFVDTHSELSGTTEGFEDGADAIPATTAQLRAFKQALETAIQSLRTGTANATDSITVARISTLDRLRRDVEDIILDLEKGAIEETSVPIYYSDISGIADRLTDMDKSIGTVIRNVSLPPVLARLFPSDMNYKDKMSLAELNDQIYAYMDTLTDGLSWKASGDVAVELKYDSQRAVDIAKAGVRKKQIDDPYSVESNANSTATSYVYDRGSTESYTDRPTGLNADGTRIIQEDPPAGGFDWKERADAVCRQIKARGLEPAAFGCVKPADVSAEYSWRGNVAMVCKRLESSTDPGLPMSVGCPPREWAGWTL
jgi:hypothetical protein